MGGMLSYFFPEAGLDTTEQVQEYNIAEEVSVAGEETQPEDPEIGAIEVTSLVILFHSISLLLLISFLLML